MSKKKRVHIVSAANAANVTKSGDTITIRDVCGATDDIVMNGVLYPGNQIAAGAPTLSDKPAPAGRPQEQRRPARQREQRRSPGREVDRRALHECTLRGRPHAGRHRLQQPHGQGQRRGRHAARAPGCCDCRHERRAHPCVHRPDVRAHRCQWREPREEVQPHRTDLQHDHLAILLDEPGAGKSEDGVGMFVNSQGDEEEIEVVQVNSASDTCASRRASSRPGCPGASPATRRSCRSTRSVRHCAPCCPTAAGRVRSTTTTSSGPTARRGCGSRNTRSAKKSPWHSTGRPKRCGVVTYESITNHQKNDPEKDKILAALDAAGIAAAELDDAQLLAHGFCLRPAPVTAGTDPMVRAASNA